SKTAAERWRGRIASPRAVAAILATLFLGTVLFARITGHWRTNLPREIYAQLVPHANEVTHPGMDGPNSSLGSVR
ncbi:MAG: hypothetical protein WCC14_04825, partial [Acidobacteriaceae bacterium]